MFAENALLLDNMYRTMSTVNLHISTAQILCKIDKFWIAMEIHPPTVPKQSTIHGNIMQNIMTLLSLVSILA